MMDCGRSLTFSACCSPMLPPSEGALYLLIEDGCMRNPLHKQQSLPLRPIIPLVARISDQNASGAPPMTVREKTRLEKFRQLLSSHNTDLGESWCLKKVGHYGALLILEALLNLLHQLMISWLTCIEIVSENNEIGGSYI